MIVARTRDQLAAARSELPFASGTLALVPTMGYLHEGHLSLVDRAREAADVVALSIFVNPTQFGPDEDYEAYPRDLERDLEVARKRGVDLVFVPADPPVVYPEGEPRITVDPGTMAERLCGAYRPGHFRGVLTVVAKLFGLVGPQVAVFGRKDFQQLVLIRRMVADLEIDVEILGAPVVREADGLAMSSRNAYLSPEERRQAVGLHRGLEAARKTHRRGERRAASLLEALRAEVERRPLLELQYAEIVDSGTLESVDPVPSGSIVAVAAFCGDTRLIDNAVFE